ncbi:MAG: hypothetical protein DRI73_02620 [Bacteroidetes bacterium]|nr:MAG: hypothetical protein DRI73_02620 [Bacteroidota bacterium]
MRKVLKIVVVLVILIPLVFFLPGIFIKSVTIEQDIDIERPPKNVFFTLINPGKMEKWIPGFKKVETLDGFIHGVGSRFLLTLDIQDKEYKIIQEITVFEWKEELGIKYIMPRVVIETNIQLTALNRKTNLKIRHNLIGTNIFWRSLLVWSKPFSRKYFDKVFFDFKDLLEHRHK